MLIVKDKSYLKKFHISWTSKNNKYTKYIMLISAALQR